MTPARFVDPISGRPAAMRGQWPGRKLVSRSTDLVVEGFPGSANSFVSNTIRDHASSSTLVESHFHYTVQLKRALALGIPAVVLVRDPRGACDSMKSKQPETWDLVIVLRWILFHRFVRRHLDELHVFLFRDVVDDVDVVRRECEAVRSLVRGTLVPIEAYRRESSVRRRVNSDSVPVRWLLRRADRICRKIAVRCGSPR